MNIINYQFASNYSNINIPGYLYNIRKYSISHGNLGLNQELLNSKNILLYMNLLYKYIKYFKKDRNYLFYELKSFKGFLLNFNMFNIIKYITETKIYLNCILNDKNISKEFKELILNLTLTFN